MVSNIIYVHPYLEKIPILTNIFQMGWNHQLAIQQLTFCLNILMDHPLFLNWIVFLAGEAWTSGKTLNVFVVFPRQPCTVGKSATSIVEIERSCLSSNGGHTRESLSLELFLRGETGVIKWDPFLGEEESIFIRKCCLVSYNDPTNNGS